MNNEQTSTSTEAEDVITTEEELFSVLSRIAEATPKRPYPKAVVEFTDKVIETAVAHGCLDELKNPDGDAPTLLSRLLHNLADREMKDHHPFLIEFAARLHEEHRFGMEEANRILIQTLGVGLEGERHYFRQSLERNVPGGEQEPYLVSTELFEIEFRTKVRLRQEGVYSDIRVVTDGLAVAAHSEKRGHGG